MKKLAEFKPLMFVSGVVWPFVRYVFSSFGEHGGAKTSAYLTYTSLFALVPLMTVGYSVLSLIPELKEVGEQAQSYVFKHFLPESTSLAEQYLQGFARQASNLTGVGILVLFVTSALMLVSVESAFNQIWHVRKGRKGVNALLVYWAVLSIGPILLGMALALTSYLGLMKVISTYSPVPGTEKYFLAILPLLLSTMAFALFYITIPNTRVSVKHGLLGGFVAAVLFEVARRGMTWFVAMFPTYALVYGAFAVVPLFLIWVYVCWNILLLGAEFVRALKYFHLDTGGKQTFLSNLLSTIHLLLDRQKEGRTISEAQIQDELHWMSASQWDACFDGLVKCGLIVVGENGQLALVRNLQNYTYGDLVRSCLGGELELRFVQDEPWQSVIKVVHHDAFIKLKDAWDIPLSEVLD